MLTKKNITGAPHNCPTTTHVYFVCLGWFGFGFLCFLVLVLTADNIHCLTF